MEILPAIDLRAGHVVRLSQGDYNRQTDYGDDPAAVARAFVRAGAGWIHMVDLDAALSGQRTNAPAIRSVVEAVGVNVELGGGIRDDAAAEAALALGVKRVVVGSAAIRDWPWFAKLVSRPDMAGKVALGLDAREGRLAAHGWTEQSELSVDELAGRCVDLPVAAIIYTDISRDGLLTGPDLVGTERLVQRTGLPIIASGGISGLDDILACKRIGCAGAIVGRAYYEGRVDLAEACRLAR